MGNFEISVRKASSSISYCNLTSWEGTVNKRSNNTAIANSTSNTYLEKSGYAKFRADSKGEYIVEFNCPSRIKVEFYYAVTFPSKYDEAESGKQYTVKDWYPCASQTYTLNVKESGTTKVAISGASEKAYVGF